MKVALVSLVCLVGCGFHSSSDGPDAGYRVDAAVKPIDGGAAPDAPSDAAPDAFVPPPRVRTGLIALWELDQHDATTIADTNGTLPPVTLTVDPRQGSVAFAGSAMTLSGGALLSSTDRQVRLNANVRASGGVTLEVWVSAAAASQGSMAAPVVIAGLCSSVNSRNISIMQAGTRWLARVRTNADANGKPDMVSTTDVVPGAMTHLVVVADAGQRTLYVDGAPVNDPSPAGPTNWDPTYKMVIGNELSLNRGWSGAVSLTAMYQQALSTGQVGTNFAAGPDGR